jgi:hypothetical protein
VSDASGRERRERNASAMSEAMCAPASLGLGRPGHGWTHEPARRIVVQYEAQGAIEAIRLRSAPFAAFCILHFDFCTAVFENRLRTSRW